MALSFRYQRYASQLQDLAIAGVVERPARSIAKHLGCSPRNLRVILTKLAQADLIERFGSGGPGGGTYIRFLRPVPVLGALRITPDVTIYALVDPRNGAVRYVGQTMNIESRLQGHLCDRNRTTAKGAWIRELCSHGLRPRLVELAIVPAHLAAQEEVRWIERWRRAGADLTNGERS